MVDRSLGRMLLAALLALACLAGPRDVRTAEAHPDGDIYTVNFFTRFEPYADGLRLAYLLDLAEVPSFNEAKRIDADGDGTILLVEERRYLIEKAAELVGGLTLAVDGQPVTLEVVGGHLERKSSPYGVDTYRVWLLLDARTPLSGRYEVAFEDRNAPDLMGWREMLLVERAGLSYEAEDALFANRTQELTVFQVGLFEDAPRMTSAAFAVTVEVADTIPPPPPEFTAMFNVLPVAPEPPAVAPSPPGAPSDVPGDAVFAFGEGAAAAGFSGLLPERGSGPLVLALSLLLATAFGALHALEPGHGKTLVAAYFAGARATVPQALMLGGLLAATHTLGVAVIGVLLLVSADLLLPARLMPWVGLASGLVIVALGLSILRDVLRDRRRGEGDALAVSDGPPWGRLVVLGLAHGFVPTPSTVVMLLAAVAVGHLLSGLLLIVAFGLGLGVTLAGVATAAVLARRWLARRASSDGVPSLVGRAVVLAPAGAAAVLVVVGTVLAMRAAASL